MVSDTHLKRFLGWMKEKNLRIADIANACGLSNSSVSSYVRSDPDKPQSIQIDFVQAVAANMPIDLSWWLLGSLQVQVTNESHVDSVSFPDENILREPDIKPSYGSTGGEIIERLEDLQILGEKILENIQNMQSSKKYKPFKKA